MNESERSSRLAELRSQLSGMLNNLAVLEAQIAMMVNRAPGVEKVAQLLWAFNAKAQMEGEEWDQSFADELDDAVSRDERWLSLTIEEEREEWRSRARQVMAIVGSSMAVPE